MKHSKLISALCFLLVIAAIFTSCESKYGNEAMYKGTVINTVNKQPFPNLEVKVTDGEHINVTTKTDENGKFSILVKFNEINANYYLLIGDASCVQVRRDFNGFGQSEINLGDIEVEGPHTATITTLPVSNISSQSATSGGNITEDGRADITARGVCWSKNEYPTVNDSHTTNGTGKGEFQSEITGLELGASYYVRAYATNAAGTVYGNQHKFIASGYPIVSTDPVSEIKSTSVVCGGTVETSSKYSIKERGLCWSSSTATPTKDNDHTTEVPMSGHFSSMIINLTANTTYYIRAFATNEEGTSYGQTVMFKTSDGRPTVITTPVGENITETTITTGGNVSDDGGYPVTSRGIVWNTVPYPTLESGNRTTDGTGTGYFGSLIQNVKVSNTNYYIRAYAVNANGVAYGEQVIVTSENYKYCNLKTISHGGYTCKVYPMGQMTWQNGFDACENLAFGGYNDWEMADEGAVQAILGAYGVWTKYAESSSTAPLIYVEQSDEIWTAKKGVYFYVISVYYQNKPKLPDRCYQSVGGGSSSNWWWTSGSTTALETLSFVFAVRKYRAE